MATGPRMHGKLADVDPAEETAGTGQSVVGQACRLSALFALGFFEVVLFKLIFGILDFVVEC